MFGLPFHADFREDKGKQQMKCSIKYFMSRTREAVLVNVVDSDNQVEKGDTSKTRGWLLGQICHVVINRN